MRPSLSLAIRASRRGHMWPWRSDLIPSSVGQRLPWPPQKKQQPPRRNLFGFSFGKNTERKGWTPAPVSPANRVLLSQDDLFHPLSKSPIPAMRARGERVRSLAPCPVSLNRDGVRRAVQFDCPECGWPTHYSEKEWKEDKEHGKYIARLREANEDEHDLRSGREMTEFKLPGPQGFEENINFSSWDILFYTRNFNSIETDRSRRHVSKLLTFPVTIAGVIHENSPYTKRSGRLTHEGLRSMIALRQTLHPSLGAKPSLDVMRIFIVGARAESSLPPSVWDQITYMFPGVAFHLFLIGPEVTIPSDAASTRPLGGSSQSNSGSTTTSSHNRRTRTSNYGVPSKTVVISEGLTMTTIKSNYEEIHAQLEPFDPYTDIFFAFSPGFGFPSVIGQNEVVRQRWEEEGERQRMKNARETYHAKGALSTQKGWGTKVQPFEVAEGQGSPAGGDVPAAEPIPATPYKPTSTEMPEGRFTSLTAAPIVQAQREWAIALGQILSTKCALVSTGFSPADVERDILAFESVEGIQGEFEWLLNPGENVFASQQWAVADFDPRVAVKANWGIWTVRGKRYDIEGPRLWGGWRGNEEEGSM